MQDSTAVAKCGVHALDTYLLALQTGSEPCFADLCRDPQRLYHKSCPQCGYFDVFDE